jgi:hypothetical protein
MSGHLLSVLDVFGTSRKLPQNYVTRDHVDTAFIKALSQDRHVVVHGSSKQGKTSLRKKHLFENDYITITCQRLWKLNDIHEAILKSIQFCPSIANETSSEDTHKVNMAIGAAQKEEQQTTNNKTIKKHLEINLTNTSEIIQILQELNFKKFIVIEEFHYLEESVQVDFAQAMKAFHELSDIVFIVVGVWLEEDKLTVLNNDLHGRIISVNADSWHDEDIDSLFKISEQLLNLNLAHDFKENIKKYCKGNIFLIQEVCLAACEAQNIFTRQEHTTPVGDHFNLHQAISKLLDTQTGRYHKFFMDFSAGYGATEHDLYKWILCPLITLSERTWQQGMTPQAIRRYLEKVHPNGRKIKIGRLIAALNKVSALQLSKKTSPIIIEYNPTRSRLNIVDKGYLVWRHFQDKETLLSLADLSDEYQPDTED